MKIHAIKIPVYLFFASFLFLFSQDNSFADEKSGDYFSELLSKAKEMSLSEDRYWAVLLHYKKTPSGSESYIDDPRFFLAPDGKVNPKAELEETLSGFFREDERDENPRCRFIARYTWLKEKLNIDDSRLPIVNCPKLDEALANINPKSAVLVYADAHINSPASMFGHTLIRLDSNYQPDLLSYAVNYAAVSNDKNPFVYAFKGIFGQYKGYFSIHPYHEKVKEYNDMEQRDIWEYYLNLSEEEVKRMLLHTWELKDIYSYYYFFNENCSYSLLFLLETARPSVHLTDKLSHGYKFWVIPTDTLRAVRENGLIEKTKYRPSLATRIRFISSSIDGYEQETTSDLLSQRISPKALSESDISLEKKIKILDLTTELIQYRYTRREIENDNYLKQFLSILNARSRLGITNTDSYNIPSPPEPEKGHFTSKVGIGLGYRENSFFSEVNLRPSYHSLLDPDENYIKGAEIKIFDTSLRYYAEKNRLVLQSLHFIDIVSLSSRGEFLKPISWKVNTGFDRDISSDGEEDLIYRLNFGGGLTYDKPLFGLLYIMPEADFIFGGSLKNNFSLGVGVSAGFIKTVQRFWKINPSLLVMSYELGDKHFRAKLSLEQNFRITRNNSIVLSISRERTYKFYRTEVRLCWNIYL